MPVYVYACVKCDKQFDAIRTVKRRLKPPACPECGFPAKLIPSSPVLQENIGTKLRAKLDKKKAPEVD